MSGSRKGKPNLSVDFQLVPFPRFVASGRMACTESDPELFYPLSFANHKAVKAIKDVCAGCPVRVECEEHGLAFEVDGAWGGLTPDERRRERQRRGIAVARA